jgi:hypothetical protein
MKLAIMQPYAFPYLGYFQLMDAVDRFLLYDNAAFIKGGWINRNFLGSNRTTAIYAAGAETEIGATNLDHAAAQCCG